ncbi:hypothetical protein PENTCL1PPCAC_21359, partial [Pristionchus entomophagus]
ASFCGDSAIPFSLEILPDGQPILGCERPSCFEWAANGQPASITGSFYNINGRSDGYMRAGRDSIPAFGPEDARFYRPQTAVCEPSFTSTSCPGVNQWVGGIAPLLNVSAFQTMLQCCTFDGLLQSEDRGVASLIGGQMVKGGEVLSSGIQTAFDFISNVAKVLRADGSVQYDVSVRRMPCADLSDPSGAAKIPKNDATAAAQAFQAPNVPVDQPIPLPPARCVPGELLYNSSIHNAQITDLQKKGSKQNQFRIQAPQFVPQPVAAPPQYAPPISFYSSGGGATAQWCFSGDMTVRMIDGSTKRMDELTKQDWVLSMHKERLEYVPVKFWLHRVPSQEAEFNVFETEDGKTIKLTDKHYIYKGDCSRVGSGPIDFASIPKVAVTADELHAGDCLFTLEQNKKRMREVRIVRAGKVNQTGIYAPMTSTGRIIVNDVYASCHNIMQANSLDNSFF